MDDNGDMGALLAVACNFGGMCRLGMLVLREFTSTGEATLEAELGKARDQ